MIRQIHARLARIRREQHIQRILFIDVGKNLHAFWLAAKKLDLQIVAIADANLGKPGRRYRGVPVMNDAAARALAFDAAILTNISPVHGPLRMSTWRSTDRRPIIDLFESELAQAIAA